MQISDFDYELPEELIAQQPIVDRDASRMLVLDRQKQNWHDSQFRTLPDLLSEGDVVVLNNTRVFPARLRGSRVPNGGQVELLLLREIAAQTWEALTRPARRLKIGTEIKFADELRGEVIDSLPDGIRVIRFDSKAPVEQLIEQFGEPPLPPYIKRPPGTRSDRDRYQTIYASQRGAIAAPTAGLHFTAAVIDKLKARGVQLAELTLHVGYGTFEPVRVEDISEHRVAAEWFSIESRATQAINLARKRGKQILAVGTTTVRALESAMAPDGEVHAQSGQAALTIVPGYRFRAVDMLLTNFHLPRSSLLMLVSAFAGRELILKAYQHAVEHRYRFYSYGDCMLIS
jgi:S-adenosylmethionine:tRNA ribosyltransferase-isomerase